MAEATWTGSGSLYDPVSDKTYESGVTQDASKKDIERLSREFPGRFVEGKPKAATEEELHSPIDVSEAEADGTLVEGGKK